MDINKKVLNILIEQNNTSSIIGNYQNTGKFGYINTSYFNFRNSIVSVDIDSKYYNLSSGYRKRFSNIYKLAFGNTESLRLNILDEIDVDTAYNDAFEISNILIKNSDMSNEYTAHNLSDVRDFLIMLILHIKCSDYKDKTLYGCLNRLFNYENTGDSDTNIKDFFDKIVNCCHCSNEIHEFINSSSKRFTHMNKNMIDTIYHKALSLLSIFQNSNLRIISSQSDFCIKDLVMNKPKSLYITLSSSDTEIYSPYIKMIITFLINKIKKYYCFNVYNRKSVLFLIDEFQKSTCNPINLSIHNKKYVPFRKLNYENKLNIPFVTSRENLIKECKETLKPDLTKKQWFNIPDEMYMRNEEVMYEPLFTSTIPCEDEIEETYKINNDYDNYDDIKLKNLFKSTDNSSSVNKDFDYERNKNNIEIIFHRDIKHKEMYYTQKNENELKEIFDLFSHNTFNKVIENYKQKNERQGIICIFSGSAGVGKTESVLQLARLIKRNIVKYDATQLTSGYIGIAAEKVKEIFNSYYKVVKNSKNHPILFLNEADSIFSRRIDLSCNANQVSSLDENRTQTILLESLENFNGIMIATTNNIINFDPAFERRFLYRIVFDKPDRSTRMKILKNKLPELKEEEIQYIVNNYNLTGAQIENISRKLDIKKIIKNGISFDDIKNLCKGETDNCFTQIEKHIGFK